MTTEADYDFMKGVYAEVKKQGVGEHGRFEALSQVRTRLFTIELDLRPELPLPQELTDKIYHEALMSELMEKLPEFKSKRWGWRGGTNESEYYLWKAYPSYWINICWAIRNARQYRSRSMRDDYPGIFVDGKLEWINGRRGRINKKDYLIRILTGNGVECDKKWTVDRLCKAV